MALCSKGFLRITVADGRSLAQHTHRYMSQNNNGYNMKNILYIALSVINNNIPVSALIRQKNIS